MSGFTSKEISLKHFVPKEPGREHLHALVLPRFPGSPGLVMVSLSASGAPGAVQVSASGVMADRLKRVALWWLKERMLDITLLEGVEAEHPGPGFQAVLVRGASSEEIYSAFLVALVAAG